MATVLAERSSTAAPAFESTWVQVRGLALHARVAQAPDVQGPPVVCVHGLGVSGRYLLPVARRLARHHPVYVPDLPGFGRSDKPARALDVPGLADALAAWLAAMQLAGPALLGNSLGCQVITDLAVRHADRLRRAVLVAPTFDPEARSAVRQLGRAVLALVQEPPSLWWTVATDYLAAGPVRLLRTFRHGLADPVEAKLPRVEVPTLVVCGGRDAIAPPRWGETMARLLPRGRLVVLPGAAHVPNYSAADDLARVVLPFLAV